MDAKDAVIAAGAALAVFVIGLSVYEPKNGGMGTDLKTVVPEPVPETRPPELRGAEENVGELFSRLEGTDGVSRRGAVEELWSVLDGGRSSELTPATRERLAGTLVSAYGKEGEGTTEELRYKGSIARLVIGKVGGKAGRDFALDVMTTGTDTLKLEAVGALLMSGSLRDKDVHAKAQELVGSGVVPDVMKPAVLRRVLGRAAEPDLLRLLRQEIGPSALRACAVELQNLGKPELMPEVLSRLEGEGLLADPTRMPWFSGKLLAEHIRTADKDELDRALHVAQSRPRLLKAASAALKERLADSDPMIRKMTASLIPQAVGPDGVDPESGEEWLIARLKEESDPGVKGTIEDSLAQVRSTRRPPEAPKVEATQAAP